MSASTYLLRVRLPDEPGVLGKVASALGTAGADIESIVIVERSPGFAVDDLVVSLPIGALADRLVSAAASVRGVTVETVQLHHGRLRLHDDLALLDEAASAAEPLSVLIAGLPALVHASYGLVIDHDAGDVYRTVASTPGAPDQPCRVGWLPLAAVQTVEVSLLWDDASVAGPDCDLAAVPFRETAAIVLGRIGGPAFRPAELTRLSHLARVAQALLPVPSGPGAAP